MGGIGKTILARALCEDAKVQANFSDGILWTTLGREVTDAALHVKLQEWIGVLGGTVNEAAPTMGRLKATLAQLLAERACLLILDDVWRRTHAQAFYVGGPRCRLLLTTRDAEIAHGLGARLHPVAVMETKQAVALLERWAGGQLDNVDKRVKNQIVARVGYLPLAIKLAGEQLRRHDPMRWLKKFDAQRLRRRRRETIHDSLFQTFSLSLDDLPEDDRRCYMGLAIFPEDERIPFVALTKLWGVLAGLDEDTTRDLLFDLDARALLQLEQTPDDPAATLHDLLHEFISDALGKERRYLTHRALLNAYRRIKNQEGWHTAPDDGYLYSHLTYHLSVLADHDAEPLLELRALFADDAWLHARVPADEYRYDGYLADLNQVWRRAHDRAAQQIAKGQPQNAIAEAIHYALIQTTINALATSYEPILVARAVETQLWSPARALSVLQRVADTRQQAELAAFLLATDCLSKTQTTTVQQLSLKAMRRITREEERAEILTLLLPYIPDETREKTLAEALISAHAIEHKERRIKALASLASHMKGKARKQTLTKGLDAARAIANTKNRARALTALAPHLEGELLTEELASLCEIDDQRYRADVLVALAPNLEHDELAKGLTIAHTLKNVWYRTKAITGLIPYLKGEARENALAASIAAALAIESEQSQAEALTTLAPYLESDQLSKSLAAVHTFKSKKCQVDVLVALIPWLDDTQRKSVLTEAMTAARAIRDEKHRAYAFAALAPYLAGDMQEKALIEGMRAARAIRNEQYRLKALVRLIPSLEGEAQKQALVDGVYAAHAIRSEKSRTEALIALASHLEGDALTKALLIARAIGSGWSQISALAAIAQLLTGEERKQVLAEALAATRMLRDTGKRAYTLTKLIPHLEGKTQQRMLSECLKSAPTIKSEKYRGYALAALVPYLDDTQLTQALDVIHKIGSAGNRGYALARVAPYLKGTRRKQVLSEGLASTRVIESERRRMAVLMKLAPHLKGNLLAEALSIACVIENPWRRAVVLMELDSNLKADLLTKTLAIAREIDSQWKRAEALISLIPHLEGQERCQVLEEGIATAYEIKSVWVRTRTLSTMALWILYPPNANTALVQEARQALLQCLWDFQTRKRDDFLALFASDDAIFLRSFTLSPATYTCIAQSIVDICTQWEWL
jgi:hypothetical protein